MVIVTYISQIDSIINMNECENIGKAIVDKLEPKDYILANIIPTKDMAEEEFKYKNGSEFYPYIHILAENI